MYIAAETDGNCIPFWKESLHNKYYFDDRLYSNNWEGAVVSTRTTWIGSRGVFTCSILASIVTILGKYCGNTYKYWPNTWKMCSPASAIFMSIDTILVSFWAILIHFKASCWSITLELTSKVDNYRNPFQIPSKIYKYCANTCDYYTCRWTHFSSIGSILVSITTILAEYCHNTCKYWAGEYTPGPKKLCS